MSTPDIKDPVPSDLPVAKEIGFHVPERYNASRILFDNLENGRGGKKAVVSPAGDATYAELCAAACQAGHALKAEKLEPFSRVLCLLDDTAVYPAVIFGAMRAGFVPVLINTLSPAELLGYYLEDSGAEVAVVESNLAKLLSKEAVGKTNLKTLVLAGGSAEVDADVETILWDDWLKDHPEELEPADTHRDDMAFWMYSSGSTGRPKGIVHLHHDMQYTQDSYGVHYLKLREDDIVYSPPKIFFAYGFGNSITFPFSVGATSLLNPGRPDPGAVFGAIETYRPTVLFGLPTLYNALMNDQRVEDADLSSLRLCISAAETLSAELFKAWTERFGFEIIEGLGSTEVLHIYLSNAEGDLRVGSAGKPVRGYDIKLADGEGEPVPDGEPGILWIRGDSTAPCYWNKPDKTAETMRGAWIYTGDRFTVDEDGFYFFQGRADDLIKVSGQWVYPMEIEVTLADHPAVKECAVLGVKMADQRMTTKAYVVLNDGDGPSEEMTRDLQTFVKQRLLPYKYPRIVEYHDSLPKTGSGKIDRQKLRGADG